VTTNNTVFRDGDTVTVTIKYGKAYEETWAVFKGSVRNVREMILEYFGIDFTVVDELTTHELVVNVTNLAHGTGNAAAILGAVAIPASESAAKAVESTGGNPWAGLGDGPAEERLSDSAIAHRADVAASENQHIIDAFAKASDVKALQAVWAANQSAFTDPSVVEAYKARGKELSGK
jgi:hypothetical protein